MSGYFAGNWRLLILAAASFVLSLASGWTTWDGMSNFTRAPVLSLLISVGIQGVMLISAWMLGEALVNRFRASQSRKTWSYVLAAAAAAAGLLLLARDAGSTWAGWATSVDTASISHLALLAALCIAALAIIAVRTKRGPAAPGSSHSAVNTLTLSLMLLVCMATSVFFSFDSLFAAVFPTAERERASKIRALSEGNKILAEVIATAQHEQLTGKARVLGSSAWREYASRIDTLGTRLGKAEAALKEKAVVLTAQVRNQSQQTRSRQIEVDLAKEQAERDEARSKQLLEERRNETAALRSSLAALDKEIFETAQQITSKEGEAHAEELGIGATNKPGRGRQYQTITTSLEQLRIAQKRLESGKVLYSAKAAALTAEIDGMEKQLLAKTVSARQLAAQSAEKPPQPEDIDPGVIEKGQIALSEQTAALSAARLEFEQTVTEAALEGLERACKSATDAVSTAMPGEPVSVGTPCSPKDVQIESAQLYAVTAGLDGLPSYCRASARNADAEPSIDDLLSQARECLQRTSLPAPLAAALSRRIDGLDRNRDDKAHRFIVTMNAFADGNRLAYLALAIALCIDGLVFVSGLLAAATRASPFTSLPDALGHTVAGADRIVRCALLPEPSRTARATLAQCKPISAAGADAGTGWTHEVAIDARHAPDVSHLNRVIGAAAAIGAAKTIAGQDGRYVLRRELVEFLSLHVTHSDTHEAPDGDRNARMIAAIGRDAERSARTIVNKMRPTAPDGDYVTEITLQDVPRDLRSEVLRTLNAAALGGGVKPAGPAQDANKTSVYLLHREVAGYLLRVATEAEEKERAADGQQFTSVAPLPARQQDKPRPRYAETVDRIETPKGEVAATTNGTREDLAECCGESAPRIEPEIAIVPNQLPSPRPPAHITAVKPKASGKPEMTEQKRDRPALTITGDTLRFD